MNFTVFKALFLDALYQVLDNKVFRILAVITLLPIAFTFLVAFKEDHFSVLFGIWDVSYADMINSTIGAGMTDEEAREIGLREDLIQNLQRVTVEGLSGTLGVMLSIAATAFFVPRMLERGTADTLFSKPVSRATLLLARYAAGLLFVAFLSIVLVFGMHIGFTIMSGYSDPGFLWGSVTLIYVFALIHGVSVAVAAVTRSSVAAILISLMLFAFGGCIHPLWIAKERVKEEGQLSYQIKVADAEEAGEPVPEKNEGSKAFPLVMDILHYPLPKTTDASILTQKLRRSVNSRSVTFTDPHGDLEVDRPRSVEHGLSFTLEGEPTLAEYSSEVAYVGRREDEEGEPVRVTIRRNDVRFEASESGSDTPSRRERSLNRSRFVRSFQIGLKDLADEGQVTTEVGPSSFGSLPQSIVRWSENGQAHQLHVLHYRDQLYEIEFAFAAETADRGLAEDNRWKVVRDFFESTRIADLESNAGGNQIDRWYAEKLSFSSPWKFNILFSIGSSLAFLFLMLGIAIWRVRKIDF